MNPTASVEVKSQMNPQTCVSRAWVNTSIMNTAPVSSSKPYAYSIPTTQTSILDLPPKKTEQHFSTNILQPNNDHMIEQEAITADATNSTITSKEEIIIDEEETEPSAAEKTNSVKGILKTTQSVAMNVKGQAFGRKGNTARDSIEMHRTHKYENGEVRQATTILH